MTERLDDQELRSAEQLLAQFVSLRMTALVVEVRERRRADENIARLVDVIRGYHERHGMVPNGTTLDLLDVLDDLLRRST